MIDPGFFDPDHYLSQVDAPIDDPLSHYLTAGYREGYDPTPFFDQKWYAWQNPDYRKKYHNPYLHYLDVGRLEGRDPCARADMKRYEQMTGAHISRHEQYAAILSGVRAPALGVYETWDDLKACQRSFMDSIGIVIHRIPLCRSPRPYLVFLQCGTQTLHRQWLVHSERSWDLLVNYYDAAGYDPDVGEIVFFQPGTKFTGVYNILTRFPQILREYRYILFLDDDIIATMSDIDTLFRICEHNAFDLAQMSLSANSCCVWPLFFNKQPTGWRHVTGVEIMMPVLSARAISIIGPDFGRSVSGFGLDLLFGKKLINAARNNIAVIDEIVAQHRKPIDDTGGGYYAFLRSRMINPKAELWHLVKEHDLPLGFWEFSSC